MTCWMSDSFRLIEEIEPALHQNVVIRDVARGEAEFADAGFFGDGDPDFRDEHAFQIQGDDGLFHEDSL